MLLAVKVLDFQKNLFKWLDNLILWLIGKCNLRKSISLIKLFDFYTDFYLLLYFTVTCRVDNDCFLGHICLQNLCMYGCRSDDDCSASESCRNNKCINPCTDSLCGPNAMCTVTNQRAVCSCKEGLVPAPSASVACVRAPPLECNTNRDCIVNGEGMVCLDGLCRPVCGNSAGCLSNERCDAGVCTPVCHRDDDCRSGELCQGFICVQGCRSDAACPADKACVNSKCISK